MSEVLLVILSIIAALFAWYGTFYGVRILHRKFQSSKPELYELIRLIFWVFVFTSLGIILAVATYFYFAGVDDTFGSLTFARDVKTLHRMLEADANILGGHFLLAAFQAVISGLVGLFCLLLLVALPLFSFSFIGASVAAIFDFFAERRKK